MSLEPAEVYAPLPANETSIDTPKLTKLGDLLDSALERSQARGNGSEKPIPLPWPSLAAHFGGGLWPGLYSICSGTGAGKTQFGMQVAACAAKAGFPAVYIGLELEEYQIACRALGEEARVPWADLYLGKAGLKPMQHARAAADKLRSLPFHAEFSRPGGWPASRLRAVVASLRELYPEPKGPGSLPILVVVDYLQLVGPESDDRGGDLRVRVSAAANLCRATAVEFNVVVLVISSIARDKYPVLSNAAKVAGLAWELDAEGRPIDRRVRDPDAIVGVGKESGELEFTSDYCSIIARLPNGFRPGFGTDMVFITAKGRAVATTWSPLLFTGYRYQEPEDEGRRTVQLIEEDRDGDGGYEKKLVKRQSIKDDLKARKDADLATRRAQTAAERDKAEVLRCAREDTALDAIMAGPKPPSSKREIRATLAAALGSCSHDRADATIARRAVRRRQEQQ